VAVAGQPKAQALGAASDSPIVATVDLVRVHTKTVRYRPRGTEATWELGEPYIPKLVLMPLGAKTSVGPWPQSVQVTVRWMI